MSGLPEGGAEGAGAAAPPPTAPRGSSRAVLLEKRKAEVQDAAVIVQLAKEVYQEAWTTRAGAAMSSGYGKQVLKKKLCHIGDGDKPDGFDPSACQTYRDIDQFLSEPDEEKFFDAIKAYVVTCVVSCRVAKEGSQKLQDKWSDFLDDYPTIEELEGDDVFDTIRSQVTICCGMNAAPPQPPPPGGGPGAAAAAGASGASGGGGGGGASVINVNTYKPKLSAMPKNFESTSQEFRHMQSWLTSDARNHTKEAVSDACLMQLRIKDELELWYSNQGGLTAADWANLSEAEKVTKWITERCSKLNASVFAKEDYSAVKNYQQEGNTTVPEYLAEVKRRIEVAVLSGKVSNYIPPDLRDEEGWCRLATDGLQGKLKDLLRDETGTVHTRGVQSGTIPVGYGPTDFNKWDVFYAMAVSKATNLGIDKHRKRDGGGGDGGAKDGGGRELSARTHNRLNKERAHYVGAAASYGWTTPLGYGCFADEYVLQASDQQPMVQPCLTADQIRALKFPPLLFKANGQRAPEGELLCRHVWLGQECRRQKSKDGCPYRHISKDDFLAELQSGSASAVPKGHTGGAAHSATPPSTSTPPSSASGSGGASSSLIDRRVSLLEDCMSKQTETLLVMNAKLDSLVTADKTPEKDALWLRKQAAAKQRASLVEQMKALKTEEDNISTFDEGSNFMVPGKPADQGSSSVTPADVEYWSDSVLQDAAMMLTKGDSEQVFLANRDRGGLPLAALNVGSSRLIVMYDTGCSPSGLIMRKKLEELSRVCGLELKVAWFREPKIISGVGDDAVRVIGTVDLPTSTSDGRVIPVCCGVMENGNTGCCDVMIGNYHMRTSWDFTLDTHHFVIRSPPDGNPKPIRIALDWRLVREVAQDAMMTRARNLNSCFMAR